MRKTKNKNQISLISETEEPKPPAYQKHQPNWDSVAEECRQFMFDCFEAFITNTGVPLLVTGKYMRVFVGQKAQSRLLAREQHQSHDVLANTVRAMMTLVEESIPKEFFEQAKIYRAEHETSSHLVPEQLPPFSFFVIQAFSGTFLILRYRGSWCIEALPNDIKNEMIRMAKSLGRFSVRSSDKFTIPSATSYWLNQFNQFNS